MTSCRTSAVPVLTVDGVRCYRNVGRTGGSRSEFKGIPESIFAKLLEPSGREGQSEIFSET